MLCVYLFFICTCTTSLAVNSRVLIDNSTNLKEINEPILNVGFCKFNIERVCFKSNVTFHLYTDKNTINGEKITVNKDSNNLLQTAFNATLNTKILIHGYNSDMYLGVLNGIKYEYLANGEFNVIFINWSNYAKGPCYPAAVWNCKIVGKCISHLIDAIRSVSNSSIHLLGFSLGSHVAAFASNYARGKKIERITGLDPALPGFVAVSNQNKLDSSDAIFVDVIHTNAFMQGTPLQSGHVDFYVNGGSLQPGCTDEGNLLACSHHRAPVYYSESINSVHGFQGWACSSYWEYLFGACWVSRSPTVMGEHVDQEVRGIFLVITNSRPPYAIAPNILRNVVQMNNEELQRISNLLLGDPFLLP